MREILFRGKTIDGDWTYGYYVFAPKSTGMFGQTISEADFDKHYILTMKYNIVKEINPETVGQYTGLTDKNGIKIFEGDIVKGTFLGFPIPIEDDVFSICWQKDVAGYKANYFENIEVIGNIYDNPELLETDK